MTMTLMIKKSQLPDVQRDLKLFNIKHMPFEKNANGYLIDIISPKSANSFFLLKYGVDTS